MFDVGWSEILVIAVVAIIFIGPRELIPMLRAFGKYAGKLKRMAADFQAQFNEALREVELDSITKEVEQVRKISPLGDIKKELEDEMRPIGATMEDLARPIKPPAESAPAKSEAEAHPDAPKLKTTAAKKDGPPEPKKAAAKPAKAKPRRAPKPSPKRAAGAGGERS